MRKLLEMLLEDVGRGEVEEDKVPEKLGIRSIWDNGGKTADRYTVVLNTKETEDEYRCLSLSNDPDHPQRVSQVGSCKEGEHLGKRISWEDLPDNVRKHVVDRLKEN